MFDEGERIVITEAARHGVPIELVKSMVRTRTVVCCRDAIVCRMRNETNLSWREIGWILCRNNKTYRGSSRPVPSRR